MNRARATLLSLAVAVAAIAGVFAIGATLSLGQQAATTSDARIASRTAQLDRYQASLATALAKRPPSLPPVPASKATSNSAPVRVVYTRAAPLVRAGSSEDRAEAESAGERDDD